MKTAKQLELSLLIKEAHIQQLKIEVNELNYILDTIQGDMLYLDNINVKQVKPKHVWQKIQRLREKQYEDERNKD